MAVTVVHGNCIEVMRKWKENSVDAIVCDPPYGLGFMGKEWDSFSKTPRSAKGKKQKQSLLPFQQWCEEWGREALRILKPGGHILAFSGTRTYHRLACGLEDAGFVVRDSILWLYGSGFPKSLNVSKTIGKAAGAEGEIAGAPITDDAKQWEGWGTALKPAHEPILVARKPIEGTIAQNIQEHGTGAINIGATRIKTGTNQAGRWPANVVLSHTPQCECVGTRAVYAGTGKADYTLTGSQGATPITKNVRSGAHYGDESGKEVMENWVCPPNCPVRALDEQTADLRSGTLSADCYTKKDRDNDSIFAGNGTFQHAGYEGDAGGASRFFYCAKASRSEREAGLNAQNMLCSCEATRAEWDAEDQKANTRAVQDTPPQRDTIASITKDDSEWPMSSCGNSTTDPSPLGSTYITPTEINPTIKSKTYPPSQSSPTNAPILGVNFAKGSGGNRVPFAENGSASTRTTSTYPEKEALFTANADLATSKPSFQRSKSAVRVCDRCKKPDRKEDRGRWCTHPTVKPIRLMEYLLTLVTPKGGVVLDPFCGSGTTLVAAVNLGINCIGIEQDADYVKIAKARVEYAKSNPD